MRRASPDQRNHSNRSRGDACPPALPHAWATSRGDAPASIETSTRSLVSSSGCASHQYAIPVISAAANATTANVTPSTYRNMGGDDNWRMSTQFEGGVAVLPHWGVLHAEGADAA